MQRDEDVFLLGGGTYYEASLWRVNKAEINLI